LPTSEAAAVADSLDGGVDPLIAVWKTLEVLSGLKPLKVDVSRRVKTSYTQVVGKPTLLYRLGFAEDPEMPGYDTGNVFVPKRGPRQVDETRDLRLSTGVTIAERVQVTTSFDWNRAVRRGDRTHSINSTVKWPTLNVDISGVERWGIWGNLMEVSSLGFGYGKTKSTTDNVVTGTGSASEGLSITPRWGITWKNKMRTNLTTTFTETINSQNTQKNKNTNLKIGLDFSHNLSAPNGISFPGLRGIRFKSRMDLTAGFNYSRSKSARIEASGFEVPLSGSHSFSFSPGARYQFTDKLSGGATFRFSRTTNDKTQETVSAVGLSITTTFIF
jgi:hypothetical protein